MTTRRTTTRLAAATSRRHFLARAGGVLLGAAGFAVIEAPLGRRTPPALASHLCATSVLCGLYGYTCADSSCGGGLHTCPSGHYASANYWTRCCDGGDGYYSLWAYKDCCSYSDTSGCGHFCTNNSPQPSWCPSNRYRCTIAVYLSAC
jgi:methylamine dehydrogenase light chain